MSNPRSEAPQATQPTRKPFDRRDKEQQLKEQKKNENISSNVKQNENRAKGSAPKDQNKVNKYVEIGSALVSKYFKGYTQSERGNIRVDIDESLPFRLVDNYSHALENYCIQEGHDQVDEYYSKFLGITCLSLASKLHQSSESSERDKNIGLPILNSAKIRLPQKLHQIINLFGKTDVSNDNQIRIREQSLASKRNLVRGLVFFYGDEINQFVDSKADKLPKISEICVSLSKFPLMYDNTFSGLKMLKRRAKEFYIKYSDMDYEFKIGTAPFTVRLPKFPFPDDPTEKVDINTINSYMDSSKNYLFHKDCNWNSSDTKLILAVLLIQCFTAKHLQSENRVKTISTFWNIDNRIGKLTISEVLAKLDNWCVSDYFSNDLLQELASEAIYNWNTGLSNQFSQFLNLGEIKYSEFGSEAQLIQNKKSSKNYDSQSKNQYDFPRCKFKGRGDHTTKLKVNSSAAILGLATNLTENLEFVSGFNVETNSDSSTVLREFLSSDFKK